MRDIKFAVMADIHLDIMHDGKRRLDAFLKAAEEEKVDFIIHLGDFAYPNDKSNTLCPLETMPINVKNSYLLPSYIDTEAILKQYNDFHLPSYHTMGNHDFDFLSYEDACRLYGIDEGYYSFHKNGWHFIVLDGNYWRDEHGRDVHYDRGEYFYKDLPYLSRKELEWLKRELADGDEPVVMFSHQALFKYGGGIKNLDEFNKIISEAKTRGKNIRMCLNGHNHVDDVFKIDGTVYFSVNSISNQWVDIAGERQRYCAKTEERFPNLRYTIPYQTPIYAIVTLSDEGCSVKGKKGRFVLPGPKDIGFRGKCTPHVSSFIEKW